MELADPKVKIPHKRKLGKSEEKKRKRGRTELEGWKQFLKNEFAISDPEGTEKQCVVVLLNSYQTFSGEKISLREATSVLKNTFAIDGESSIQLTKSEGKQFVNLKFKSFKEKCLELILKDKREFLKMLSDSLFSEDLLEELVESALRKDLISFAEIRQANIELSISRILNQTSTNREFSFPIPSFRRSKLHQKTNLQTIKPPQPTEHDLFDNPNSPEYQRSLAQCQRFFGNNHIKSLPRAHPKHRKTRAVHFLQLNLLPKLVELFGSLDSFFFCFQKTPEGSSLIEKSFLSSMRKIEEETDAKILTAVKIGHQQMASVVQHHYQLSGIKMAKGTLTSNASIEKLRSIAFEPLTIAQQRAKESDLKRQSVPSVLLKHSEVLLPLVNKSVLSQWKENDDVIWSEVHHDLKQWIAEPAELIEYLENRTCQGTFLKTMYLSQLPNWPMEWTEQIRNSGDFTNWEKFPLPSHLLSHVSFLLPMRFSLETGESKRVRRRVLNFLGTSFPIFPSIRENNKELQDLLLTDVDGLSDDQFVRKILEEKKIYVGKLRLFPTNIHGKSVEAPIQFRSMRHVLIIQILKLLESDYFLLDSDTIPLELSDWWDNTEALNRGLLAWTVGFLYDENVFKRSAPFEEVTRLSLWLLGSVAETKENIANLRAEEGKLFEQLKEPFHCIWKKKTYTFHFTPAVGRGDHSAIRKAQGSNGAGHFRCGFCSACFQKKFLPCLLHFSITSQNTQKSLEKAQTLFFRPDKENPPIKIGWHSPPHILNNRLTTPLEDLNLDKYEIGPDNLHNGKGVTSFVLNMEMDRKGWKKPLFLLNLYEQIGQPGMSSMNGAHWRLLLVKHESVILPSIPDGPRKEELRCLFENLSDIQWIAYAPPSVQKNRSVRLRLHVLCFLLSLRIQLLYPEGISGKGALYLHTMISHYGPWYEKRDFLSSSTEPGEALFAVIKRILMRYTDRHEDNSLLEVFVRLHFEELFAKESKTTNNNAIKSKISEEYQKLNASELKIPLDWCMRFSVDVTAFLSHLISLDYKQPDHFVQTESGVHFVTVEEFQKEISRTKKY